MHSLQGLRIITLALIGSRCWAQLGFTDSDWDVIIGQPFDLTWTGATGPVDIELLTGPANDLVVAADVADAADGNSYTWTPPDTLASGTYAFRIDDGSDENYSEQFVIDGSDNTTPTPTSTTTSPSSTTTPTPTPTPIPASTSTSSPQPSTSSDMPTSSSTTTTTTSSASPATTPTASSSAASSTTTGISTSSSSSASSSTSPQSSGTTASQSSSSSPSSEPTSTTGLSTGAKAGIGVGAAIGGLAILGLAGLLLFRRGKAVGQRLNQHGNSHDNEFKAELGTDPRPTPELGGNGLSEMYSPTSPVMYQGQRYEDWRMQPSELEATGHSYRGVQGGS
ncbi:hypothetical protein F5Y16DRAFT_150721 [Xylariaceae sp. FL0255]|nr:hypothetical protein F5Y16DRAFT_150721 [Xylariaceae sp. FL0255]